MVTDIHNGKMDEQKDSAIALDVFIASFLPNAHSLSTCKNDAFDE